MKLTHYDILNVARDAPQEAIRAAYKALCRRYHPDLHAGSADTTRLMAIINVSYDILSSPSRRRAYDDWIAEQESLHGRIRSEASTWQSFTLPTPMMPRLLRHAAASHIRLHADHYAVAGLAMAITMAIMWGVNDAPAPLAFPNPPSSQASTSTDLHRASTPLPHMTLAKAMADAPGNPFAGRYVRASHAPNGQAWPRKAGYLKNIPILHNSGQGTVLVENSANSGDVHVKLVALLALRELPAREFYIPARGAFTLKNLSPGRYDVRYRDLDNGRLSRSDEFTIEEIENRNGAGQSRITVKLDKVPSNRLESFALLEAEF